MGCEHPAEESCTQNLDLLLSDSTEVSSVPQRDIIVNAIEANFDGVVKGYLSVHVAIDANDLQVTERVDNRNSQRKNRNIGLSQYETCTRRTRHLHE